MTNCLIVGIGGQGTILAARLIGTAAMAAGLSVRGSETIGMAQRGSGVASHVRMGGAIYSPLIPPGEADVLIAFEPGEAVSAAHYLSPGGVAVVCDRPVQPSAAARAAGSLGTAGLAAGASGAEGAEGRSAGGAARSAAGSSAGDTTDSLAGGLAGGAAYGSTGGASGPALRAASSGNAYSAAECVGWLRRNVKPLLIADGEALIGQIGARCLNVALIGIAVGLGAFPFSLADMEAAIAQRVREKHVKMNIDALRIGIGLAQAAAKAQGVG
ncbi:MAG: 2-oxoacid:acceptor oxidoreductase family protein [Clostridiales bacterium]|jgi:indolepyruvate ferredoxin oxidoreductase beta subunit|nr:2-oxoacid:acceptor oxidoreductase family protein [Clostridiales bacterium]